MSIMMHFFNRLDKFMVFMGLNDNKITVEAGISNGLIGKARKRGSLSQDNISKILYAYNNLNANWLLTGEGEMLKTTNKTSITQEAAILIEDDESDTYINKSGNKYVMYPDGHINIEVPLIPFPAYASYLEAYNDEEKLHGEFQTTIFKVDHIGRGNYIAFNVVGESMNGGLIDDTPSGAKVLAREIGRHLWGGGFRKTKYGFILLTVENIYHKDIGGLSEESGLLTLKSRNKHVEDFDININDVYKVFHVIKREF